MTDAQANLKKYFGYDTFRPGQAEIIQTVFDGRDTLVLMPTGGGKSLCFQLPAVTMPGTAVVVSPLIALMKDQVEGLRGNGIAAAFINSSQDHQQTREIEDKLMSGDIKLLYVSPEKLVSQGFQPLLKRLKISLFAIDEAHCISSWGHDFRPEYTQLKFLKEQFPHVPVLALTATADKLTRKDIVEQLALENPLIYIASFDRPNLSLVVRPGQKRIEQIFDFLKKHSNQSGIIYCLARKTCEDIAEKLLARGYRAAAYHAQIPSNLRSRVQEDFIQDRIQVVVATIAFGMGIDKSNVRFVIHYNMPRNLEGYYQEIGRSGRDGLPADTLMFYSFADVAAYRDMVESSEAGAEQKEFKLAKLNRMFEYAESPTCRRISVLAYFNETFAGNCGNCDVCLNPPRQFDGTVAAQKALSAILRTGERVGMQMLVDILRGSGRQEIFKNGYNEIKTYGAGREYSFNDWIFLISQMLHNGLVEIAYDDHHTLKVTPAGRAILFDNKKIKLALPETKVEQAAQKAAIVKEAKPKPTGQQLKDELFEILKTLRRQLAQEHGVPPYIIFSDATLVEMSEKRPQTDGDMLRISGVAEKKLEFYGPPFIAEIREYVLKKKSEGMNVPGSTFLQTWDLYQKGISIEDIAASRNIQSATVVSHLAHMYERGESLDIWQWLSPEAMDIIQGALPLFPEPFKLGDIFEHFNQKFSFDQIRLTIAHRNRKRMKEDEPVNF